MPSTAQPTEAGFLTVAQTAKRLKVSRQRVHQLIESDAFPNAIRDDSHPLWRFIIPEADIKAFRAAKRKKAAK